MVHSPRAVLEMRGVSFWSFIGPGVSARNSCVPPTPSIGRIGDREHDDAQAADVVEEAAPDVDRQRQLIETD